MKTQIIIPTKKKRETPYATVNIYKEDKAFLDDLCTQHHGVKGRGHLISLLLNEVRYGRIEFKTPA